MDRCRLLGTYTLIRVSFISKIFSVAATACPENIVKYYREIIAYVPDVTAVGYKGRRGRFPTLPHRGNALSAAGGRRRLTPAGLRLITFYSQMERFVFMMLPQCRFSAVVYNKRMVF
jgi:hypothetical protein